MAKQLPVKRASATALLTSCTTLVDIASCDNRGLNQTVGISAQSSFFDQPPPHEGPGCLVSVELTHHLLASLGRPVVLAISERALVLNESLFDKAQ